MVDLPVRLVQLLATDIDGDGRDDLVGRSASELVWIAGCSDADGDGSSVCPSGAELDCDDNDPTVSAEQSWHRDADGDGLGDSADALRSCAAPDGRVVDATDCDDSDPTQGAPTVWFLDHDRDGAPNPEAFVWACEAPENAATGPWDCDDTDPARGPGQTERCNDQDDDCDGIIDNDAVGAPTWWSDADGDGYGNPMHHRVACTAPSGFVTTAGDCDDSDPAVSPAAGNCDGDAVLEVVPADAPGSRGGCQAVSGGGLGVLLLAAIGVVGRRRTWLLWPWLGLGCGSDAAKQTNCPEGTTWRGDVCVQREVGLGGAPVPAAKVDCDNGLDDDLDSLTDCEDLDCLGLCPEDCGDGLDNDGDGDIDQVDSDCGGPVEDCSNGTDDDRDGLADCAVSDCAESTGCREDCTDGLDNDQDGRSDCEDAECIEAAACHEDCTDGIDNDEDGAVDCEDDDCFGLCGSVTLQVTGGGELTRRMEHAWWSRHSTSWSWSSGATYQNTHTIDLVQGRALAYSPGGATPSSCTWWASSVQFGATVLTHSWSHGPSGPVTRGGSGVSTGCLIDVPSLLPTTMLTSQAAGGWAAVQRHTSTGRWDPLGWNWYAAALSRRSSSVGADSAIYVDVGPLLAGRPWTRHGTP